jgi:hypothetical protein
MPAISIEDCPIDIAPTFLSDSTRPEVPLTRAELALLSVF